jgi:uncharacterized protein YndB with AHSA1/START domain
MAGTFPLEGGCGCGLVRYRLQSGPLFVHCCHCRWCQRESGAAFALNAMIEADRVALMGVQPELVDTPSASGEGQKIARCPQCRVAVWSHYASAGPLISFVRVGTLDRPGQLPPDIHIFTESRQPWVILPEGTPVVPEYYDRERFWPAASLERREALLPAIEAYQSDLQRRQVVHSRVIDAAPATVFAAFADPAQLTRWWGPAGFSSTFERFEPRPGGRWIFTLHGPDGTDHPNEIVFIDVTAPDHVRLEHIGAHWFELLITFTDAGAGRTKVGWRQRFDSAESCQRIARFVREANEQNLDRLQAVVSGTAC